MVFRQPLSIYLQQWLIVCRRLVWKVLKGFRTIAPGRQKPSKKKRTPVSAKTISDALDTLGVESGDVLLVHSGISNLGKIEGGSKDLFLLLRKKVGEEGVLLFPVFPFESTMHEYLSSNGVFNVSTSPSMMGALTEFALNVQGRLRSLHPSHSVVAIGANGAALVSEHHLDTRPFGKKSPFWKLTACNGKILLIGVGLNSVTNFHVVEDVMGDRFPVKVYLDKLFDYECIDQSGNALVVKTLCHDPNISKVRNCERVTSHLLQNDVMRVVKVGEGEMALIDAQGMLRCLEELCVRETMTIYGKLFGFI